jgi:hypothetical protein
MTSAENYKYHTSKLSNSQELVNEKQHTNSQTQTTQ